MKQTTPENISSLESNQIFVFGSNLAGIHGGGAARFAAIHFGAAFGEGVGRTGQCYAIPTMHGGPEAIAPYVNDFVKYAAAHPELEFLVTRIGCGIAGFDESEIAPLFKEAYKYSNIVLPKEFVAVIECMMTQVLPLKRVYVDMDNVLVDFGSGLARVDEMVKRQYAGRLDEIPGIFSLMQPMPGAVEAMHKMQRDGRFDLYILSTAPWKNPSAWSDKLLWVQKYLDDVFYKRIIITHCKNLLKGDYLIDDRGKNGTEQFDGEWIQFGSGEFPNWNSILRYFEELRI